MTEIYAAARIKFLDRESGKGSNLTKLGYHNRSRIPSS